MTYRTTPSWRLFHILHNIATNDYHNLDSPGPHPRELEAIEGARGEIFAGLETTMAHFQVLLRRDQLLRMALQKYHKLIEDLEINVM
jgi:hypothetical protein